MDYVPSTDSELEAMLRETGAASYDDLVAAIPPDLRHPKLRLPAPMSEIELAREVSELAYRNTPPGQALSFLGAGAYEHFIPAAIDHLASRGEFYTAYTPYQAEASQGTLQVIYEFQTLMCALTGMEVSNASLYDGATAMAEAACLALNARPGRRVILAADTIHPEYMQVLRTHLSGWETEIRTFPSSAATFDAAALVKAADGSVAAVICQNPNFLGRIEDMARAADIAHAAGALFIAVVNPLSLGLLMAPGEYGADLAVGEGQPLGIPLSFGGPYLGFMTAKKELVHKMPGRLVGRTLDTCGAPGFCLTLQAREQHIRREKATSNICTNQGLMALRACIYLCLLGREGLREVAEYCAQGARFASDSIAQIPGFSLAHPGPVFNEFVVACPIAASRVCAELEDQGIFAGLALEPFGGAANHLLVCVTEAKSRPDIERYLKALAGLAHRAMGRQVGIDK
ncbi:MAG TPA: aminomethyl-transferring glycine dehydrogenase subunit GcvPA [Verrucomicrobiae bacterium]|nr:aminomethyl-transferring glycine dehydrogenase subunit GcvPA [Verrucomicrobiae bacterium]